MKLIHTLSSYDVFGPEKTVLNECLALSRVGWDTEIVNFWDDEDTPFAAKARARGVTYSCIASGRKFDPAGILALRRRIRALGRPLVHSHGYKADLYSLLAARLAGVPLVTTVHGWTSENFKVRLYEKLQAGSWRFFDRVFCVSESYRRVARGAGVAEQKLILVPNGIMASYHVANAAQARAAARQRLDLADEHVAVAIIGRLGIEKGHAYFLRSAADVLRRHPQTRFLVIGEGAERGNIESLAEQLDILPYVQMLGHQDDMPEIYPAIDVLAIASLREGLPNVLLEAMLHSIPAVATAVGGIPDVICDGDDGLLAPPQDIARYSEQLARIVGDPMLRRAMGDRARQKIVQDYLFEQRIENVERLYNDTLGNKRSMHRP